MITAPFPMLKETVEELKSRDDVNSGTLMAMSSSSALTFNPNQVVSRLCPKAHNEG